MQKLHLVGFTTDLDGLIFSARKGSKAGGYMVPLDKELLATISEAERLRNGDKAKDAETKRGQRPDSRLTPREIQAYLRSGRSIPEVAAEAGVNTDWVERFAVPIVAEQAQMVERARAMYFSKARLGQSYQPLGTAVRWNLADKGVALTEDEFEQGWSAFQLQNDVWMVRFRYTSRQRLQVAEWELDLDSRTLHSRNRVASDLGYVEKGRRPPALPTPVGPRPAAAPPVRVTEEVVEAPPGEPEPQERASAEAAPTHTPIQVIVPKRTPSRRKRATKKRRPAAKKAKKSKKTSAAKKSTTKARSTPKRAPAKAKKKPAKKRPAAKKKTATARRSATAARATRSTKATTTAKTPTKTAATRPSSRATTRPTTRKAPSAPVTAKRPMATRAAAKRTPRPQVEADADLDLEPTQAVPAVDAAALDDEPAAPPARERPVRAGPRPARPARPARGERPRIAGSTAREAAATKRTSHAAVRRTEPDRPLRPKPVPAPATAKSSKAAKSAKSAEPAKSAASTPAAAPVDGSANMSGPLARSLLARRLLARKAAAGDSGTKQRPLRVK